jgi:hypothetical protein
VPIDPLDPKIVAYRSLLVPANDTDPVGGGIDLAYGAVSQDLPGVVIPTDAIPTAADVRWRYKLFRKNENDVSIFRLLFWIRNGLRMNHAAGQVSIYSDNPAETGFARITGEVGGVDKSEDVTINGLTSQLGNELWDANTIIRGQKLSPGGALTNSLGNVYIVRGTSQGIIPAGFNCATGEFELGLDLLIDDDLQAANRLTDPADVVFSRAVDRNSAITGPDVLAAGEAIGYWLRMLREQNVKSPLEYVKPIVVMKFEDVE